MHGSCFFPLEKPAIASRPRRWQVALVASYLLLNSGCLSSPPALSGAVGGIVALNGKPVTSGQVELHGDQEQIPLTTEIRPEGTYSLESVSTGTYRVAIVSTELPDRYSKPEQSGLLIEIEAANGPLTADFELRK